jgi:predicted nucleotidyltransferase
MGDRTSELLQTLGVTRPVLEALCARFGVRRLELFGSALRADFGAQSDVDVLVEFAADRTPSLGEFVELNETLSRVFGRRVDVMTRASVESSRNPVRRAEILSTVQVLYAA